MARTKHQFKFRSQCYLLQKDTEVVADLDLCLLQSVVGPWWMRQSRIRVYQGRAAKSGSMRKNKLQEMIRPHPTPHTRTTRYPYRNDTLPLLLLAARLYFFLRTPSFSQPGARGCGRGAPRLPISRVFGGAYLVNMQHRHMLVFRTRIRPISERAKDSNRIIVHPMGLRAQLFLVGHWTSH